MPRRAIFLGFECNNRCLVCAQGDLRRELSSSEEATILDAVNAIQPGEDVAFVGGEPTLSDGLPELVRLAEERGAESILVQTNARRLAYPAYADALCDASKRLAIDASLFGASSAMHDYHTRVPQSFAQTARGIRRVSARGVRVGITVVVTRSNYRHLGEIVRLGRALGADAVHLATLERLGSADASYPSLAPNDELARPYLAAARADAARLGMRLLEGSPEGTDLEARFAGTGPTTVLDGTPLALRGGTGG